MGHNKKKPGRPKSSSMTRHEQLLQAKRRSRKQRSKLGIKEYSFSMREEHYLALHFLSARYDIMPGEIIGLLALQAIDTFDEKSKFETIKRRKITVAELVKARRKKEFTMIDSRKSKKKSKSVNLYNQ